MTDLRPLQHCFCHRVREHIDRAVFQMLRVSVGVVQIGIILDDYGDRKSDEPIFHEGSISLYRGDRGAGPHVSLPERLVGHQSRARSSLPQEGAVIDWKS